MKQLTLFSLALIFAHGIEEIITGFWKVDSVLMVFNERLESIPHAVYWASHVSFWLFLIPMFLLVLGGKWTLRVLALFGVIFIIEIHHILGAIFVTHGYYPGLLTAILYPIVGFFYWKELIKHSRATK